MTQRFSILLGLILLTTVGAHANDSSATPWNSMCGDWDLGPASTTALRISLKNSQDLFVQYCNRDELLNQHICNANVILYFSYSSANSDFVHDDNGAQHLHATLQIDPTDPTVIHYTFKSDVAVGAMAGKKL